MKSATKRKILALPVTALIVVMLFNSGNTDEYNNKLILEAQAQTVFDPYGYISDTIEESGSVFTAMITVTIRILALLIVLSVIGFITGTFINITGAVKGKLKIK